MSIADELGKLDALRKQGILTDAEFEQRKRSLLGGDVGTAPAASGNTQYAEWSQVPLKNKWWFQALLTLVIIPLGLIFVMFFKSYQKKNGAVVRHPGVGFKIFFVIMMLLLWAVLASLGANPGSGSNPGSSSNVAPISEMVTCDSSEARQALTNAIENNATSNIATLRLLDLQNIQEVSYDPAARTRRCSATFVLNSGRESSGYTLSPASTPGNLLVEIN